MADAHAHAHAGPEFAYVGDGRVLALAAGTWWEYLGQGELGEPVIEDDGSRGFKLVQRIEYKQEAVMIQQEQVQEQVQTGVSVQGRGTREHIVVTPQVCHVTDDDELIGVTLCGRPARLARVGFDMDSARACPRCVAEVRS